MKAIIPKENRVHGGASRFDNLSFSMIFVLAALMPIFFIPWLNLGTDISKGALVSLLAAAAFFFWLVARMKDGTFMFPKSIILAAGALLLFATLLSSVFSTAQSDSFIGLGYEMETFAMTLAFIVSMFLASVFFQRRDSAANLYGAIFFSAGVVFAYQFVRFFASFSGNVIGGVFENFPVNLVGKWTDFAIFFGLIAVLLLVFLELAPRLYRMKPLLRILLAIALLMLVVVNMKLVWILVGFFSLLVFVYAISFGSGVSVGERKIPLAPFAVLIISLFFTLAGGAVSNAIYSAVGVPQEVVRPTWSQTFDVAQGALSRDPVFGAGTGRFFEQWLMFKPSDVNATAMWNIDFGVGVGLIPSMMIAGGGVVIVAWLVFLGVFLYRGIKALFIMRVEAGTHYLLFSSFLAALYLWLSAIFYVPNITILFLAFFMTGVFIAVLAQVKAIHNYNFSFLDDPRVGFVSVLVLILLIIGSVAGLYVLSEKFGSVIYFRNSIITFNVKGDLDKAEQYMVRAIRLRENDLYYRSLSEINLSRLGVILSKSGVSEETIKAEFQSVSEAAVQNALRATEIDENNYLNWMNLARVYGTLMSFGAPQEFYVGAGVAYERARTLNPRGPAIVLAQARLAIAARDIEKAKAYIAEALNLKNNYTEAIFLLSQIQADEGNLADAIVSASAATRVSPNDIGAYFQLGFLRYRDADYVGAISAFERAVELSPSYSNAKYFLGLSYSKEGFRNKAIQQFEDILVFNQDNEEIKNILRNIRAGRSALSGITDPEEREDLPFDGE